MDGKVYKFKEAGNLCLPELSDFPNEGYVHLTALVWMDSSTEAKYKPRWKQTGKVKLFSEETSKKL